MLRKLLILSCLLGGITGFAQNKKTATQTTNTKVDYKAIGAPLPPMRVVTMPYSVKNGDKTDSIPARVITNKTVQNKANLILMLFNPTCSHCEDQTALFEKNIGLFDRSKLVLVATPQMRSYMDGFIKSYNVNDYPTLMVGSDSSGLVDHLFTYHMLPQINIYDKDRVLIKTFTGNTPIDSLKEYIQ